MVNTQLKRIAETLTRHKVPYVIIGGHAVNAHGYVRATEDTDVLYQRTPESEKHLLAALRNLNANWIGDEIDPDTGIERLHPITLDYIESRPLMMLVTDAGFLDLFDYVPGLPDQNIMSLLKEATIVDDVPYVSLPWLRKMKQAAGRIRDQLDLEELPE